MTGVNGGSQGSLGFDKLDMDNDGRISLTEFTKHAGHGSSASTSRSATGAMDSSSNSTTDSAMDGRSGVSTGVSGGSQPSQSGQYTAAQFQKLDTDHDGYLSRSELNAVQNGSSSDQIKP